MSASHCIVSRAPIQEGDRVVAVLCVRRLRHSAMMQEYAPIDSFSEASAASFPIRGKYGLFGSLVPDEGQPALEELRDRVGIHDFAALQDALHSEGLEVMVPGDQFPGPKKAVRKAVAFAFVHETLHDEFAPAVDAGAARYRLDDLLTDASGSGDDASRARYHLIEFHETSRMFGDDWVSAMSRDRIGNEVMSRIVECALRPLWEVRGSLPDGSLEAANDVLVSAASLTAFEYVLRRCQVDLRPSPIGTVDGETTARLAAFAISRVAQRMVDDERENGRDEGEPGGLLDTVRSLADEVEGYDVAYSRKYGL